MLSLRYSIVFLLLFGTIYCFAQAANNDVETVYPIRRNHKVGYIYIKNYGAFEAIPPKYDYIGDTFLPWNTTLPGLTESPYRLFMIDEKLGLLDTLLREVIPNKYKRIRPLSDQYFAVEVDSLFVLTDRSGQVVDSTLYQNICLADPQFSSEITYLFVQNNNRWGIRQLNGPMIRDYQYADIQPAGKSGFYKVKTTFDTDRWQLIDLDGKALLPKGYRDILILDQNLIAVKEYDWFLYRRSPRENPTTSLHFNPTTTYEYIEKVNDRLAVFLERNETKLLPTELWDIGSQEKIQSFETYERSKDDYLPTFEHLDQSYSIQTDQVNITRGYRARKSWLIDNQGNPASGRYDHLAPTHRPYIYLGRNSEDEITPTGRRSVWTWKIVAPKLGINDNGPKSYHEIFPFQGNLAVTRTDDKYGLIYLTDDGKIDRLKENYTYINIVGQQEIHVQLGEKNIRYTIEGDSLRENLILDGRAISKNKIPKIKEAAILAEKQVAPNEVQRHSFRFSKIQTNTTPEGTKLVGTHEAKEENMRPKSPSSRLAIIQSPTRYTHAFELSDELIGLTHPPSPGTKTTFGPRVLDWNPAALSLYNFAEEQLVATPDMIGFRAFDKRYTTTTFIAPSGKMGLIDKYGKELLQNGKPIRYTYIGPFFDGKAVACKGGKLVLNKTKNNLETVVIRDKSSFVDEFHIKPHRLRGKDKTRYHNIHLVSTPEYPVEWVYIDPTGKVLFEVAADLAHDFNEADHTAQIDILIEVENNIGQTFKRTRSGLIDAAGRQLLKPEYNSIKRYADYYVVSKSGTPTISFTEKGHQIRKNPTRLRPFFDELSVFRAEDQTWGYIDKAGRVAIEPQFQMAKPFFEGRALVRTNDGEWIFIDTTGNKVFGTGLTGEHQWIMVGDFKEGRCWFKQPGKSLKWGLYDRNGNVLLEPRFYYKHTGRQNIEKRHQLLMDFSKGAATVQLKTTEGQIQYAVIDTTGNFLVQPKTFAVIDRFDHNGYAIFRKEDKGTLGLMSRSGSTLLKPAYHIIEGFVNGYARVKSDAGYWGIVDVTGTEVIPAKYLAVDTVSEGLVAVQYERNAWRYVDLQNRTRIKGPFEEAPEFENGITLVVQKNKQLIINNLGEPIRLKEGRPIFFSDGILGVAIELKNKVKFYYADAFGNNLFGRYFTEISPFHLVSAKVKVDSEVYTSKRYNGAINKQGVMVVPPKFNTLHFQPDGTIIVNPQVYKGIVGKSGKTILPVEYDQIIRTRSWNTSLTNATDSEDLIFRVEDGEKIGYVRLVGEEVEWLWELGF